MRFPPFAYWALDESPSGSRTDSLGNYPLTEVDQYGNPPATVGAVSGKISNAADHSSFSFLKNENTEIPGMINKDFSVTGWFKIDGTSTYASFFSRTFADSQSKNTWKLSTATDRIPMFRIGYNFGSSSSIRATDFGAISINTWYFLCGVLDHSGGNLKIYVNGSGQSQQELSYETPHQESQSYIQTESAHPFVPGAHSQFDELAIWRHALSDAEISYLYNSGSGRTYPFDVARKGGLGLLGVG